MPSPPWSAPLLLSLLMALPLPGRAGTFGVSPIRVDLDARTRSGAVTISSDEADSLRLQLRLVEWQQGSEGQDVYTDSDALVFFPRLMTMGKNEQRLVRVGLRIPPEAREKAYRLFIEELPPPPDPGTAGTSQVAITVRFGVPVFVKPAQEQPAGAIEHLELDKGKLRVRIRNTGNVHFRIGSISARDEAGFATETQGWYLLAGAMREHELPIDAQQCSQLRQLSLRVVTDKLELQGTLPVDREKCGA